MNIKDEISLLLSQWEQLSLNLMKEKAALRQEADRAQERKRKVKEMGLRLLSLESQSTSEEV